MTTVVTSSETALEEWYRDGMLYREDGPAVVYRDGGEEWYVNDELHRTGGPAARYAVFRAVDGQPELVGFEEHWYHRGLLHRLDGPASEYPDGRRYWRVHGRMAGQVPGRTGTPDAAVLDELAERGDTGLLEMVLTLWHAMDVAGDAPPLTEIVAGLRAAATA